MDYTPHDLGTILQGARPVFSDTPPPGPLLQDTQARCPLSEGPSLSVSAFDMDFPKGPGGMGGPA